MVDVHYNAANSFWPSIALPCALGDKGVIDIWETAHISEGDHGYLRAEKREPWLKSTRQSTARAGSAQLEQLRLETAGSC